MKKKVCKTVGLSKATLHLDNMCFHFKAGLKSYAKFKTAVANFKVK